MEYIIGIAIIYAIFRLFKGKKESAQVSTTSTKYFQNKCYVCEHYSKTRGTPRSASDTIKCPVGGTVRVGSGCGSFKPDITATCGDCWNFRRGEITDTCTIHGKMLQWRQYCPDAVNKDS